MIFKTTADIKKYFPVTSGFSFDDMLPFLNSSVENFVHPFLSKAQYLDLDAGYNGIISPAQTELLPYAQSALAYISMYKYSFIADKEISQTGISVNEQEDKKMLA